MSRVKLSQALTIIFFSTYTWQISAATDAVVRHRAIVDAKEPDLSNKIAAVMRSELVPGNLTIRCHSDKGLSAEIDNIRSTMNVDTNDRIRMRYQADLKSASEDRAWYSGPGRAIMPNSRQILQDALNGSALHMQFEGSDGPTIDMVFQPRNISVLLRKIQSDCPDDAPPPDQTGLAR